MKLNSDEHLRITISIESEEICRMKLQYKQEISENLDCIFVIITPKCSSEKLHEIILKSGHNYSAGVWVVSEISFKFNKSTFSKPK